ncbi:MAG: cupin domain-containing protein [Chloroflexi bacterium]|nr:cupin domain-containing protein [Chloroflexota bacterium]
MQTRFGKYGYKDICPEWMEKEGIPVYRAFAGIEDLTELPRRPWARLGGSGTFIEMESTRQARTLLYVAEIPPGGALEPEKHLYDELIYILRGRGLSEVWNQGQPKRTFEWGEGSLFAIPLNAWHRFANGGREPALFFAVTCAPLVMEAVRNTEFVFNCDYNFTDRFGGQSDYFLASEKRSYVRERPDGGGEQQLFWETNFIPDVRTAFLGNHVSPGKIEGGRQTRIRMAGWARLHTSEWPSGKYHKAHHHGPGAIIMGLRSEGYVMLWHKQYGIHPFQDGHGDKVMKVNWKPGSIYSPPREWFHQHFNTGREPARHWADTGSGIGNDLPTLKELTELGYENVRSVRDGGRLIHYEDEDPEIRRMFQEELRQKGIECTMSPVVYRTDPFELSV